MVDFKKKLATKNTLTSSNPVEMYETLDRAHDKGPLRPAQIAVLKQWFSEHSEKKDVVIKLHTGQGKTLVGLLLLLSRIQGQKGRVLYLCPDNNLVSQTCEQAKQFGIQTCVAENDIPQDFLDGKKILVTSVQKLFNGFTKFGLDRNAISVDTILMDDAHSCSDIVRDQCRIRIPKEDAAYSSILHLFSHELEQQGVGTFADIGTGKRDAFLPVPYWAWLEKEQEVAKILSLGSAREPIKYQWPIIKNILARCSCIISGQAVEIEPNTPPMGIFGSYSKAAHRVFMSATVTDDAFLVRGLQIDPQAIANPISYEKETWSGEKMILIPSLIDEDLTREWFIESIAANSKRSYGVVALTPSFDRAKIWEMNGAYVANKGNIAEYTRQLNDGKFEKIVVLANRYDGIDLPDESCRILIIDSKPFSENLLDLYQETCRPASDSTSIRVVRTVEQGMGRSVRGEKDYSVIIILGNDLVRLIRDPRSREYFSSQLQRQVKIGLEIVDMAKGDVAEGKEPGTVLNTLIKQCLSRDVDWKSFYVEQMRDLESKSANMELLNTFRVELDAEQAYIDGEPAKAISKLQSHIDKLSLSTEDKGWYLQEMARYAYGQDKLQSQALQIAAFKSNQYLLRPSVGVNVTQLSIVGHGRAERIIKWLQNFESYAEANVVLSEVLGRLSFGVSSEKFEAAINELGVIIGFKSERPDKYWKEGPDNLWAIDSDNWIVWECKNEVDVTRSEINKREAEQMNRSAAWFDKHYGGKEALRIIIHPANKTESAAAFTHEVFVTRPAELKKMVKAISSFFREFAADDFKDLSAQRIQTLLEKYALTVNSFLSGVYHKKIRDLA